MKRKTKKPEPQPSGRIQIMCERCGSTSIVRDATAGWDVGAQDWVLESVHGDYYCCTCDNITDTIEVPLK